ncbi:MULTISPECIES: ABC transporter permease [unclassified Pseudomonas]|uniref:ABC transporter permease n=1 Tax=unclassified Pseudomonas TaxID=196821 RepID=UPI0011A7E41E|nr:MULTISPECIES: ABC transporter permease [unclassified Pseudomonas]TWC18945.1 putative ABC transport system permease protein [Pseudomonas sp. SJZ075]TWC33381.1 putative ABC transport system permease protein [Pseudomonas sp. SJZ078]TWC55861.1 putative ABC transport system permease protein [Pseudomonas sp. SJZ124]TWC91528.1 putative ABC transport system permease protein [Pseudomonas sp. SJZ101]
MARLPLLRLFSLAVRQLLRDARAGELRVLFFALLVAVAASTAIGYFGARLNGAMMLRATEFLGADLLLEGSSPARPEQIRSGTELGLEHALVVEFSSVVATDNGIQLSSVKAADDLYPLRGELKSAPSPFAPEEPGGRPNPGEAWVEARLLTALDLKIGDSIDVGNTTLRLSRVLTYEPDRAGNFYSLTPRVMINLKDLEATGVVQPGSRVSYRDLWRGPASALQTYRDLIKPGLEANQRLQDARDGNRQIGGALGKAERYLNMASLVAVLLSGVAVALSANRFATRRFDASALLRCLGLSRRETMLLFSLQLTVLGLLASLSGALLGWIAQLGLFALLHDLLPATVPPGGLLPAIAGIGTGLVALAGFALPPLAALGRVPPLRVLRRDMLPIPSSTWVVYGAALGALGLIMWRLSLDLVLTFALLGGGVVAALVLGGLLLLLLQSLRRMLARASLPWRLGLGQLLRHPLAAAGQALAFGLILLSMALIALLRGELLDTWQNQLPKNAPNYFALNILPNDKQAFIDKLLQLSAQSAPLYPVVPGRLISINGEPAREFVTKDSAGDRALQRDLSLTWAADLPEGNVVTAGNWWPQQPPDDIPGVSVEGKVAENLQIKLGDRLVFSVGGINREAKVTSLREINWDNFQPNFFMIFQPGTLKDLPATYLTSFYLAAGHDQQIVDLARAFPAVTILQVEALLQQLRSILAQVTLAVEYVLLFVLAAGMAVLFSGLQATLDERIRQGALLRALGAERPLLVKARRIEFGLLGAVSGLLAALGSELVSLVLYRFAFDLPWHPHPWLLMLPLAGALLIGAAGVFGTRRALNASPLTVLREG